MKQVSHAYLLGIGEGRSLLRSILERGEPVGRAEMAAFRDNCAAQLKRGFGPEMAETFRGERDFWQKQLDVKQPA